MKYLFIKSLFCLFCFTNLQTSMATRPGSQARSSVTTTKPWPHTFKTRNDKPTGGGHKKTENVFTGKQIAVVGALGLLLVSKGLFWVFKKQVED